LSFKIVICRQNEGSKPDRPATNLFKVIGPVAENR
jgi:hypothetical protein